MNKFKVGDEIIVTGSYRCSDKGSIGVIKKIKSGIITAKWTLLTGDADHLDYDYHYEVLPEDVKLLTKLDKVLK